MRESYYDTYNSVFAKSENSQNSSNNRFSTFSTKAPGEESKIIAHKISKEILNRFYSIAIVLKCFKDTEGDLVKDEVRDDVYKILKQIKHGPSELKTAYDELVSLLEDESDNNLNQWTDKWIIFMHMLFTFDSKLWVDEDYKEMTSSSLSERFLEILENILRKKNIQFSEGKDFLKQIDVEQLRKVIIKCEQDENGENFVNNLREIFKKYTIFTYPRNSKKLRDFLLLLKKSKLFEGISEIDNQEELLVEILYNFTGKNKVPTLDDNKAKELNKKLIASLVLLKKLKKEHQKEKSENSFI